MIDEHDLLVRLAALGDALAFDDTSPLLEDAVLARLDEPELARPGHRWLAVAAAVLVATSVAVAAIPDARQAIARWFGLDGLQIDVDPSLTIPPVPVPVSVPVSLPSPSFDVPGPGESRTITVDGREVLISTLTGALDRILIGKTVGSSDQIQEVTVDGDPGLWISGGPHEVLYETLDGNVVIERVAVDTLLWQAGDTLFRIEGCADLAAALAIAGQMNPGT